MMKNKGKYSRKGVYWNDMRLFHHCLSTTGENIGPPWDEHIVLKEDSVLANVFLMAVSLVCLCCIGRISEKLTMKARNIILWICCAISAAISFYWVLASKVEPVADQSMICQYANAFNMGDFPGWKRGIMDIRKTAG